MTAKSGIAAKRIHVRTAREWESDVRLLRFVLQIRMDSWVGNGQCNRLVARAFARALADVDEVLYGGES